MYNYEQKRDFYVSQGFIEASIRVFDSIFNKYSKMEEFYEKDLCNFTKEEILEALKAEGNVATTLESNVYKLKAYTNWCCENGRSIDGINHYDEILIKDIKRCANDTKRNARIKTREEVLEMCSKVEAPDAFLLLGLFEGLGYKNSSTNLFLIKREDIDVLHSTVDLADGRKLTISKELLKFALSSYDYRRGEGYYLDVENVLPPRRNTKPETYEVESKIKNRSASRICIIKKELEEPLLSQANIAISGFLYYLKKRMKKLDMTFDQLVYKRELYQDISYRYSLEDIQAGYIKKRYKEYLI